MDSFNSRLQSLILFPCKGAVINCKIHNTQSRYICYDPEGVGNWKWVEGEALDSTYSPPFPPLCFYLASFNMGEVVLWLPWYMLHTMYMYMGGNISPSPIIRVLWNSAQAMPNLVWKKSSPFNTWLPCYIYYMLEKAYPLPPPTHNLHPFGGVCTCTCTCSW